MPYKFDCQNDPFTVTSENQDEVVDMVQQHARNTHDMEMDEGEIADGMQEV